MLKWMEQTYTGKFVEPGNNGQRQECFLSKQFGPTQRSAVKKKDNFFFNKELNNNWDCT